MNYVKDTTIFSKLSNNDSTIISSIVSKLLLALTENIVRLGNCGTKKINFGIQQSLCT